MPKEKKSKGVSATELEEIVKQPALYANKVYVTSGTGMSGVKLTFAEFRDEMERPSMRTAVFLSTDDAGRLVGLLETILRRVEEEGGG